MNKTIITLLLFCLASISKAQVAIIDQEFEGVRGLTYIPFSFFNPKPKPQFYHPTGFYERSRLFFKYATANKIAPSARFKALTSFDEGDDCPFWNIESKYSKENNSGPILIDPSTHIEDTFTEEISINVYSHSRNCYEHSKYSTTFISKFSYKIVTPQWDENKIAEIKSICNNTEPITLKDYFKQGIEVDFRLDDPNGNPIQAIDPKQLSIGDHAIYASKQFDNGLYQESIKITILPSSKITFGAYPDVICANIPPFPIPVLVNGAIAKGKWSGTGISNDGIFNPKDAGVGIKMLTYSFTNPQGCTSSSDIHIEVKPVPMQPTVIGKTDGCAGDILKLSAVASAGIITGYIKYAWYKYNEQVPFYIGTALNYTIQKTEKLFVKGISDAGCFSDESTEVNITSFTPIGKIVTADKTSLKQGDWMRFKFVPERGTNDDKYNYVWDFGDDQQSYEATPPHYFNNVGTFLVKVTITSPEQCANTIVLTDSIHVADSGIPPAPPPIFKVFKAEEKVPLSLNLFPNPFANWLKFTVNSKANETAEMIIANQEGFIVYRREFPITIGDNEIKFDDFQNLTNLLYQIQITSPTIDFHEVFIKKN